MLPPRAPVLWLSLFLVTASEAAPFFSVPFTMATGTNPIALAVADINLDGRPDIITANLEEPTLSLFTNRGGGRFSAIAPVSLITPARKVLAEDVNGDGRPDLLALQLNSPFHFFVLTNGGAGAFTFASSNSPGGHPGAFLTADLNKDGWNELIVADGGFIRVLTNNHHGAFTLSTSHFSGFYPYTAVAGDFNGDGGVDIIGGNYEDPPSLNTNNGSGGMVFSGYLMVLASPDILNAVDVNHDGRLDVTVHDQLLTNNGAGVFTIANTNITGGTSTRYPVAIAFADFNDDGWPDLVGADNHGLYAHIRTNDHANGFSACASPFAGVDPRAIVAADMNGDGRPDLVVANDAERTVSVLLNHRQLALSIERHASNGIQISWPVTEPQTFLETATNLVSPISWTPRAAGTNAARTRREVQRPTSLPTEFFRLRD